MIEFALPETPTSGYMWEWAVDERIVRPVVDQSRAPEMPRGAPGERLLAFEALAAGETELRLVKRRPWEDKLIDQVSVIVAVASTQPPAAPDAR